jgi:cell wall-associated NlpC family hydrolase
VLQPGDVILMKIAATRTNHGAIYLGDNLVLQYCMGRLSSRDVWGGAWRKAATHFLRYVGQSGEVAT